MKKIFTLVFAFFLSVSVYARDCPYCGKQFDKASYTNHISLCFLDYSDSEYSESSSSDNMVPKNNLKREHNDSDDQGQPNNNKRKKINDLSKSTLSDMDSELIQAATTWDYDKVENLLQNKGINIDAIGNDGSALRCAISALELDIGGGDGPQALNLIQLLLDNNASVMDAVLYGNAVSILMETASFHEHQKSDYTEDFERVLNILLSTINDWEAINDDGMTALAILVQSSVDINILESAIKAGAEVNVLDNNGISILTHAINNWGASTAVSVFLIEQGAVIGKQEAHAGIQVSKSLKNEDSDFVREWEKFAIKLLSPQVIKTMLVFAPVEAMSPGIVFPLEVKYNILGSLIGLTIDSPEVDED